MTIIEKLTESEEVIMRAIWDCKKEPGLSDVLERVNGYYGKDWKPQTVSTFLSKLCRKHYLELKRNGKIYTYKILVRECDYRRRELNRLYYFLYQSNKKALTKDMMTL